MANPEHVAILKQGVKAWNEWRKEHSEIVPDLSKIDFNQEVGNPYHYYDMDDLDWLELTRTDLSGVDFSRADLYGANLLDVNLYRGDLSGADLRMSQLRTATLSEANLRGASLIGANLYRTDIILADLRQADLSQANLKGADLRGANLKGAQMSSTILVDVDLEEVEGLETVEHRGPSSIGIDTIVLSDGKIPDIFLRKAGVPASIIESIPSLIGSLNPIDFYSCFISYSSKDQGFADRLYADLQSKRIRCWFAPHDMRIGDKIRPRIDESIRLYDKLLLVLSEHSVASQWVEHEVETALGKELEGKPNVLFPIRLDDRVMESKTGWASHIRLTRHIGDFTCWKNRDDYQQAFERLLHDLKSRA